MRLDRSGGAHKAHGQPGAGLLSDRKSRLTGTVPETVCLKINRIFYNACRRILIRLPARESRFKRK